MKATLLSTCLALSFLCFSCKTQNSEPSESSPVTDMRDPVKEAEIQAEKGNYQEAADILSDAMCESTEIHKKNSLFKTLLEILLDGNMNDEAGNRYIAALGKSPQSAFFAFGTISGHMKNSGDNLALAEWSGELVQSELPATLKKAAANQRNKALLDSGRFHGVLDAIPEHLDALPDEQFQQVMEELYILVLNNKKQLTRLNTYCERQLPDHSGLKELRTYIDIKETSKENLSSASKTLAENFDSLSDHYLSSAVNAILQKSLKENETGIIEDITDLVFSESDLNPRTVQTAAPYWLKTSKQKNDSEELVEKLKVLLNTDMEPRNLVGLFKNSVYALLAMNDMSDIKKAIKLGYNLLDKLESQNRIENLRWLLFDMHCFIEDFAPALRLLDRIKEPPTQNPSLLRNKILAHQAMKEENWNEAIKRFRDFMKEVKKSKELQSDPVTGNVIPYQSILGLNAKRIGDIYLKQGKEQEAIAAYREANQYYNEALKKISTKSNHRETINQQLEKLEKLIN